MAKTRESTKEVQVTDLEVFILPEREAMTTLGCGPLLSVNANVNIDVSLGGGCGDGGGGGGGGKC